MAILSFHVGHVYCFDCVKAIEKFVTKMAGVQSVSVENNENAVIEYNPAELEFDEDKWVKAVQFIPGDAAVLHHLLTYVTGPKEDFDGGEGGRRSGHYPGPVTHPL